MRDAVYCAAAPLLWPGPPLRASCIARRFAYIFFGHLHAFFGDFAQLFDDFFRAAITHDGFAPLRLLMPT